MEERQGWERPGWFNLTKKIKIMSHDYSGFDKTLSNQTHQTDEYRNILEKEYSFQLSPYDNIVRF